MSSSLGTSKVSSVKLFSAVRTFTVLTTTSSCASSATLVKQLRCDSGRNVARDYGRNCRCDPCDVALARDEDTAGESTPGVADSPATDGDAPAPGDDDPVTPGHGSSEIQGDAAPANPGEDASVPPDYIAFAIPDNAAQPYANNSTSNQTYVLFVLLEQRHDRTRPQERVRLLVHGVAPPFVCSRGREDVAPSA